MVAYDNITSSISDLETLFEFYESGEVDQEEIELEYNKTLDLVEKLEFKTSGKQIISPGWRIVYHDESIREKKDDSIKKKDTKEAVLPNFEKGEKGPHTPLIHEGKTSPPKYYTEASLLRSMETAGKLVDNDEMRDLMKENGIGRPSTRANIIETLFRRTYIERKKKNIYNPKGLFR